MQTPPRTEYVDERAPFSLFGHGVVSRATLYDHLRLEDAALTAGLGFGSLFRGSANRPAVLKGINMSEAVIGFGGDGFELNSHGAFRFRSPTTALLAALAVPTPTGQGGHQWHEPLCQALESGDALPWFGFADWCEEEGFSKWEEIARQQAAKLTHRSTLGERYDDVYMLGDGVSG